MSSFKRLTHLQTSILKRSNSNALRKRSYHSFPDPNEKPQITTTRSDGTKQMDKPKTDLSLHENFKMEKPFPDYERYTKSMSKVEAKTFSTILSNGITVASEDRFSLMTSLALVVKTGSSYETEVNTGVTQMIELNAFKSNATRSHEELSSDIENLGGMVQCISTRENIFYCVDILRENIEKGLDILAETIFQPTFPDIEIEESKSVISWQSDELPGNILSRDAAQMAAFQNSPLSNFHYCPPELIPNLNAQMIRDFQKQQYYGKNMVIAGAGIDHETLVKLVEKKFKDLPKLPPTTGNSNNANSHSESVHRKPSIYTGGMYVNERELKEPFARVCLAFECGGWSSEDLVPLCVMQLLLGGGSSFSAGGPGKGMYTRLYREVLNRCYWAESAESFLTLHEEGGIFGIDGSCTADFIPELIKVIVHELTRLAVEPVKDEELLRAQNMLKSLMMMQLESRMVLCEDIGRQFITYGHRQPPEQLCRKIENVTKQDLLRVAMKMILTKPSIGLVGPNLTNKIPKYDDIKNFTEFFREDYFKKHNISSSSIANTLANNSSNNSSSSNSSSS